jgi:type IV pilus assembly protein PilB
VKIMSKLDIAERRLPQDGRMSMRVGKKKLDFRVSTLPTIWGEKVVMRILDKSSLELDLTKLGMAQDQLDIFRWGIDQPYGMVLVTGPSGCGKTTTLYSALLELNKITDNVSTAEDPVEYYLEGINQVQMQDEIGLNFAFTLRAFLRQDPDIIMVGEVRDFETAEISIKAALTGHLVLSTVHTNDAPSTVSRLLNMGIEPFLLTASLNTVCSQRLVRKICPNCMEPVDVPKKTLISMGVAQDQLDDFVPYIGKGCSNCSDRGYKGRIGLYEILKIRGDISDMIIGGATPGELKREAMRMGMRTLRQAGLSKVKTHETSLEEVTRTTMPDFIKVAGNFEDVDE